MRTIIASALFLCFSLCAKSATNNGYFQYNSFVNKAELAITKDDYKLAELYYDSAFSTASGFSIDIQNALLVLLQQNKMEKAMLYANKLAVLGIGRPYFEKKKSFSRLKAASGWKKLLEDAARAKTEIETSHQALLTSLTNIEREYFSAEAAYLSSDRTLETSTAFTRKTRAINKKLFDLFSLYGYPSEQKIGVNLKGDTVITDPAFTSVIYASRFDRGDKSLEVIYNEQFLPLLSVAMNNMEVRAESVYNMVSCELSDLINIPRLFRFDCALYLSSNISHNSNEIDKARMQFGLSTLPEAQQKARYNFLEPSSPFVIAPLVPKTNSRLFGAETSEAVVKRSNLIVSIADCK